MIVRSPVAGTAVGLGAVPDVVFAGGVVGPGTAVDPGLRPGVAVAPIDGMIVKLRPHAFVVVAPDGRGVLVHLGIDTVGLPGAGFEVLAAEGEQTIAGRHVVAWDPGRVRVAGCAPICPVVALDAAAGELANLVESGPVESGDELFIWA